MIPIFFRDAITVEMMKQIWSDQEIALAQCYGFQFYADTKHGTKCVCNIKRTDKQALINFIALSFRALMESSLREHERDAIIGRIDEMYKNLYQLREDIFRKKLPYWDDLYQHQKDGILVSSGRQYNLLAFDQGTGKTITAASKSRAMGFRRTLVVCIPVAKWNWLEDLTVKFKFNPMYFSLLDTKKSKTIKAFSPYHERFCITHYEALPKYMDYLLAMPFDHIILDECQFLKNIYTNKFKNVEYIASKNEPAHISMLSGTPMKNRVDDLFAYFKLSKHEMGKNYTKFKRDYAAMGQGRKVEKVVGAKNMDQLRMNMSNFMIRVLKEDCLDLPDRNYMKVTMDLDDYKADYDKVIADMLANKDKSPLSSAITSLNRILAMAKVKGAIELIDELLDQGKKVVIFSSYSSPLGMLKSHYGNKIVIVDGKVPHSERFERVKQFRDNEEVPLFGGNIIAAGTSLNLTVATEVIFLNYAFTSTEISQCVDRVHRIGQEEKVNIYFLNCKNTIDDPLYNLVATKQGDINKIIDGGKGMDYEEDVQGTLYKMLMGISTNEQVAEP